MTSFVSSEELNLTAFHIVRHTVGSYHFELCPPSAFIKTTSRLWELFCPESQEINFTFVFLFTWTKKLNQFSKHGTFNKLSSKDNFQNKFYKYNQPIWKTIRHRNQSEYEIWYDTIHFKYIQFLFRAVVSTIFSLTWNFKPIN